MNQKRSGISVLWSGLNKVNRVFGFFCLLGIIFCIGGQVISRMLTGHVWAWAEEISEVFLIGTIVLYNGYAEQTDEHIRLEALFSVFPKMKQPMLQIGRICTMAMCAMIVYTEISFIPSVKHAATKVAHIPLAVIHGMILIGFVLWFLDLSINCWKYWKHIPIGNLEEQASEDAMEKVEGGI